MSEPSRLDVLKTYKLFIGGAFPRSESGRTEPIAGPEGGIAGHASKASRKDLREAVAAARKALPGWKNATAYNRGQVLYRMAEMLEARRGDTSWDGASRANLTRAVDRLVHYAGWTDKLAHVLGGQNAVAGPYWNFTVPEAVGVVGVVCPAEEGLLALVTLLAPVLAAGNTAVVVTPAHAATVMAFAEVCATSDVPGGVVNVLTGEMGELVPVLAKHRDVDAVHAAGGSEAGVSWAGLAKELGLGSADNLKRVKVRSGVAWSDAGACEQLAWVEPFVEFKTVWHPVGA